MPNPIAPDEYAHAGFGAESDDPDVSLRRSTPALPHIPRAITLILLTLTASSHAAPKPVPPSPYLGFVYRYADAILKHARDTHGPHKTPLLLSALDRTKLAPLQDRPIADPHLDQNLLRILYTLSELSGKPIYREAADAELKWLLESTASPDARPAPWDTDIAWNVLTDKPARGTQREYSRAWMLWDRCFLLAPDAANGMVRALQQDSTDRPPAPHRAGFSIRACATLYQHTRDPALLNAIDATLTQLQAHQDIPARASLSLAIDCAGAASRVPQPLATRLKDVAGRHDAAFLALPHDLKTRHGFALIPKKPDALTPLWFPRNDLPTTATLAMLCVSRYENTADTRYRDVIHAAAHPYLNTLPPADADVPPMIVGHAISLQLAAWRSTSQQAYLDSATNLANHALQRFWPEGPLPRAGLHNPHYDAATGADTLALSLIELHLSILHITAVRPPPNTLDRP